MTITSSVRTELAKLGHSSIIELFELKTSERLHGACEVYRFHAGVNAKAVSGHLVWAGETYYAWPVEAEGFEINAGGTLPRPKIRIANTDGSITTILLELAILTGGQDLAGAMLTRIRTLARFLDAVNFEGDINPLGTPDPECSLPEEIYYIDRKSAETKDIVEFELASAFDFSNVRLPKRQALNNICQWIYRGEECGYTGTSYFDENDNAVGLAAQDICGKRLTSCEARFGTNELPYGGFPGVGQYAF
jgi:lambda family phage minor tail protein L